MTSTNDGSTEPKLKCCCGRPDCAYLEHNNAAVDGIEKKLERAAQLGQVRAPSRLLCLSNTLAHTCSCVTHNTRLTNTLSFSLFDQVQRPDLYLAMTSIALPECLNPCCAMHMDRKPSIHDESSSGLTFALQALLSRHESFVAESQQEHARLDTKVGQLEAERSSLQSANERIVAENRELISKLETLNDSYKASDNTVKTLEGLLRDTEIEVRRLNGLARRAEELDARVHEMDLQRMELMRKLNDGETESRSTLARWRESERKVRQLELDVQKIEWEARLERDKHEELVARLERERVLERELGGAEGRLKGAAALHGIESGNGGNVVSHFVRDILQDNANLQAGIVELRELLQSSNDEVQNLRQQVMHHQPVDEDEVDDQFSTSTPLDQELGWNQPSPQPPQREVHVHHHYHAKLAPKQIRTPAIRRPSRRRAIMGPGGLASSPGSSIPSTPIFRPQRFPSSPIVPVHLNQPQPRKNRWSVQSSTTMASTVSSLPSSPRSYIFDQNTSIFDRLDAGEESSRPTSPESAGGYSSPMNLKARADGFEAVLEDDDEEFESNMKENIPPALDKPEASMTTSAQDLTPQPSQILTSSRPITIPIPPADPPTPTTPIIEEEDEEEEVATPTTISHIDSHDSDAPLTLSSTDTPDPDPIPITPSTDPPNPIPITPSTDPLNPIQITPSTDPPNPDPVPITSIELRPSLHRSSSHDSLVSISGMDIHIAKRPTTASSSSRIRGNAAYFPVTPSSARSISASQPLATITDVSAVSSKRSFTSDNQGPAGRSLQSIAGGPGSSLHSTPANAGLGVAAGLGKIVGLGGWVRGKWGVAPMKSGSDLRSHQQQTPSGYVTAVQRTPPRNIQRPSLASVAGGGGNGMGSFSRTPGINQSGAIPGLWVKREVEGWEVRVEGRVVDEDALREGLAE